MPDIGLGLSVGSSLLGGFMEDDAAGDAANTQAASSAASIAEQRRQYDLTRGDYAPARARGERAAQLLEDANNSRTTIEDTLREPGYQFGLQQGQQGIDRKFAAAGGRISGAALKAASEYNTGYASTMYGAADQRRENRLNRLAALAGLGQTATNGAAQYGNQSANNISSLISGQGNAAGAAQIAQGNIWGGTANQLGAIGQKWATGGSNSGTNYLPGSGGSGNGNSGFTENGVTYNNPSAW